MNMRIDVFVFLVTLLLFLSPSPAHAYLGPGAGLSALGSVIALCVALFAAIVGFFWYPVKRLLGRTKTRSKATHSPASRKGKKAAESGNGQ